MKLYLAGECAGLYPPTDPHHELDTEEQLAVYFSTVIAPRFKLKEMNRLVSFFDKNTADHWLEIKRNAEQEVQHGVTPERRRRRTR